MEDCGNIKDTSLKSESLFLIHIYFISATRLYKGNQTQALTNNEASLINSERAIICWHFFTVFGVLYTIEAVECQASVLWSSNFRIHTLQLNFWKTLSGVAGTFCLTRKQNARTLCILVATISFLICVNQKLIALKIWASKKSLLVLPQNHYKQKKKSLFSRFKRVYICS